MVSLQDLDQELSVSLSCAWSRGTVRTRNSQWHKFLCFFQDNGLCPLPASDVDVCRFLVYLARTCVYSTIDNYLSAIIALQRYHGFEGSYRNSYLVKLLLSGLKNQLGTAKKPKLPLSIDQLLNIYSNVNIRDVNDVTCWSALIFCFRTLLRKCHVVPDGTKVDHIIRRKDIQVSASGIIVKVHSSKTIKHKERVLSVPVNFVSKKCMCAASLVLSHFLRRPGSGDDFIFYLHKPQGWVPLYYKDMLDFLKRQVSLLGLDPKAYGIHSLRRAAATYYHSIGLNLTDIMLMGDWRSLAVFEYLMLPDSRKMSIETYVCHTFDNL